MAIHQKSFDKYRIDYPSGGGQVPSIECFDGITRVGRLIFHDTEGAPPDNLVAADGALYLRYRLSQFNDVVNILRYEKPLYVRLSTETLVGRLATHQDEPIGEQEPPA